MSRSSGKSAGAFVAGLTALAFAVIAFLAYQADAAQDDGGRGGRSAPGPTAAGSPSPSASTIGGEEGDRTVPADSGQGRRVVYSLERDRVWLVEDGEQVARTYRVRPGSVDPTPGAYKVTSRTERITGTDGVPVENVVIFGYAGETVVGFSAAVDGSSPAPEPTRETGGIRERTADGVAMWEFAEVGTPVVVVR